MSPFYSTSEIQIFNSNILNFSHIPERSVDLIITSPPYNLGIEYSGSDDSLQYGDYLDFSEQYLKICYKLAKDDGRFCLNIPVDKNKGGQQPVLADITQIAKNLGWKYHSTIIWLENNISKRTAWGSWMSASAPYVIAPVEAILVLYKTDWKKHVKGTNDIAREEFMEWTNGMWSFPGQKKKEVGGHPAAFPVELPRRCIKLFSYVENTVFDPFVGSGSTLLACAETGRTGIGVEIDRSYCEIAEARLTAKTNKRNCLEE